MNSRAPENPPFWRDWPFWSALAAGPLCWVLLTQAGVPLQDGTPAMQTFLLAALLYPIVEEYVFRGGLQAALYQKKLFSRSFIGLSLANVLTSVVFTALHFFNQPPLWAAAVFLPSLVFGWMRDRYGHIHASIVLHVVYNTGFIWLFTTR